MIQSGDKSTASTPTFLQFTKILLKCLQENLPTICSPGSIFIQDNTSTHTAKIVQDWLTEWAKENCVEVVEWLPYTRSKPYRERLAHSEGRNNAPVPGISNHA